MTVVVTGMGIVCAAGRGVEVFAEALEKGIPGDRPAPHLEAPDHQARVGATIPDEALGTQRPGEDDRVFALGEAALAEAVGGAGLSGSLPPDRTALIVGTSLGGVIAGQEWHRALLAEESPDPALAPQAPLHALADHLGTSRHLTGPRTTVSNACVSGTNAVGLGLDMLRAGECDVVLAGGVDTLHSFNFSGFATLWALTSEKVRPFDPSRSGMLLGEAGAFVVMERLESVRERDATASVLAEVAGYGSSGDAVHITAPDRHGGGAYRSISMALGEAGLTADDVDLVSLHGTGTLYADGMEAAAMGRVFGERSGEVPAFSLRPVTGHPLAAAGAVDTVACLVALQRGLLPPTANHQTLDPDLPAPLHILKQAEHRPVRVALNTSSGFAGSNASVVLRAWDGGAA